MEQGATRRSIGQDAQGNLWVTRATIRILVSSRETHSSLPDAEMRTVCLHEIGHALGLFGHSTNNEDIMFFCGTPSSTGALTERDRQTIGHLYQAYPIGTAPASAWDSQD
jgi:predicted Zn-dependent protease